MDSLKVELEEKVLYAVENDIKKILMFIKDEKNIIAVQKYLHEIKSKIELIGVTFPANEKMYKYDEEENQVNNVCS